MYRTHIPCCIVVAVTAGGAPAPGGGTGSWRGEVGSAGAGRRRCCWRGWRCVRWRRSAGCAAGRGWKGRTGPRGKRVRHGAGGYVEGGSCRGGRVGGRAVLPVAIGLVHYSAYGAQQRRWCLGQPLAPARAGAERSHVAGSWRVANMAARRILTAYPARLYHHEGALTATETCVSLICRLALLLQHRIGTFCGLRHIKGPLLQLAVAVQGVMHLG